MACRLGDHRRHRYGGALRLLSVAELASGPGNRRTRRPFGTLPRRVDAVQPNQVFAASAGRHAAAWNIRQASSSPTPRHPDAAVRFHNVGGLRMASGLASGSLMVRTPISSIESKSPTIIDTDHGSWRYADNNHTMSAM
jgi:hypothetical protein